MLFAVSPRLVQFVGSDSKSFDISFSPAAHTVQSAPFETSVAFWRGGSITLISWVSSSFSLVVVRPILIT